MSRVIESQYLGHGSGHAAIAADAVRLAELQLSEGKRELLEQRNRLAKQLWSLRKKSFKRAHHQASKTLEQEKATWLVQSSKSYSTELERIESEVLQIALAITKKVLGDTFEANHSALASQIHNAILPLHHREDISIRLHPSCCSTVREQLEMQNGNYQFKIIEDSDVSPGTATLTTSYGSITVDWKTHLLRITSCLRDLKNRTGDSS